MSEQESVIIEVAINGSTKPERNPHVPLTPDAIRADALRCLDAGASVIHAHNPHTIDTPPLIRMT